MIFVRGGLLAQILYVCKDSTSKTICLEFIISKKKWCLTFAYRPPSNSNKVGFFKEVNKSLGYMKIRKCPCCWRSEYRYFS